MKRFMGNLVLSVISLTVFVFVFIDGLKISLGSICFLGVLVTIYGVCMALCRKSKKKLIEYEKEVIELGIFPKNDKKVLFFSLSAVSPFLYCVFVYSLIPLQSPLLWFVTVFPFFSCACLCANVFCDKYQELTNKKLPFVLWFIFLLVIVCLLGILTTALVLTKFIK